jgi:hypothetical protein
LRANGFLPALVQSAPGAIAVGVLAAAMLPTAAHADCQPNPAVSGQTVVCSGNAPNGFQADPGVEPLIVRVGPNATVHDNGSVAISVNDDSRVNNRGTISNHVGNFGVTGVSAGDNNVILNSGEIKLGLFGTGIFVGDNNIVRSSGDITVGQDGTAIFGINANQHRNCQSRCRQHRHRSVRHRRRHRDQQRHHHRRRHDDRHRVVRL